MHITKVAIYNRLRYESHTNIIHFILTSKISGHATAFISLNKYHI